MCGPSFGTTSQAGKESSGVLPCLKLPHAFVLNLYSGESSLVVFTRAACFPLIRFIQSNLLTLVWAHAHSLLSLTQRNLAVGLVHTLCPTFSPSRLEALSLQNETAESF
jgi:hypothetical protein